MRRFPTILGMIVLLLGLGGGVFLAQRQQVFSPKAMVEAEPVGVAVSNVTDRSFTVGWTTGEAVEGYLMVGEDARALSRKVVDDRDRQGGSGVISAVHYVTVSELTADTDYYFQINSGGGFFDRNGTPFSVRTGPTLSGVPSSDTAQGLIRNQAGGAAAGVIVYVQLPGGQLTSALTTDSGNWIIPLSTTRRAGLSGWLAYDRSATVYTIKVDGGADGRAEASLTTELDRPVPPIVLGNRYDFREGKESKPQPQAQQAGGQATSGEELAGGAVPNSLFSFDSLGPVTPVVDEVMLQNPSEEGEVVATDKPEFFGRGPKGVQLDVVIESAEVIETSVVVGGDGRWSLATPVGLSPGEHTVTLRWVDAEGVLRSLRRSFVVQAAAGDSPRGGQAAFTATPSATPTTMLAVTPILSPTVTVPPQPEAGTVRTSVPSTSSGVPRSGGLTPSVILFMMGVVLAAFGAVVWRHGGINGR